MSKALAERVQQLFQPPQALWACEFTSRHVIVGGVDRRRGRVQGKSAVHLPADVLPATLAGNNINKPLLGGVVREALRSAAFKGSEIAVVVPDEAARISFISTDTLPKTIEEQQTFLRWKLKKTVPFDVDTAQIAFRVVGERNTAGYGVVVALSPRSIVEEYESLMEALDIHAGSVMPSTLAALNLMPLPKDDTLFVKVAPDCVTTTVFQNGNMKFYRRVAELGLYESVYPTVLYYQDKLGGTTFKEIVVCGYDGDVRATAAELQERIGIPARQMDPRNVDDIYKPSLGAVHLSWANLI